ncbi:hypothetical protein ACX4M5_10640 [Roseomonas mucosa]|uniref:hypothetical protein n=1 Tax=Roseomonas mucosa TaxID=207340 RepID=UPI001EF6BA2F|nr:hypothetical protein [Roseomonas mucosa]MCG7354509.1 hypothetical protein [Roseomonas mucosa]
MDRSYDTHRTELYLSAHGRARARHRGTTQSMMAALAALADLDVPVGGGCVSVTLSRTAAEEAQAEGCPPALLDRLRRRAMVVADNGDLVTLLIPHRRRGRRYRRAAGHTRARQGRR